MKYMKETEVKNKDINKITLLKFFVNLREILVNDDAKEIDSVEKIDNISKADLKEYKVCFDNIKKLEEKYGIETKNLKKANKKSPTIRNTTIHKGNKGIENNINEENKEQEINEDKIQEI